MSKHFAHGITTVIHTLSCRVKFVSKYCLLFAKGFHLSLPISYIQSVSQSVDGMAWHGMTRNTHTLTLTLSLTYLSLSCLSSILSMIYHFVFSLRPVHPFQSVCLPLISRSLSLLPPLTESTWPLLISIFTQKVHTVCTWYTHTQRSLLNICIHGAFSNALQALEISDFARRTLLLPSAH